MTRVARHPGRGAGQPRDRGRPGGGERPGAADHAGRRPGRLRPRRAAAGHRRRRRTVVAACGSRPGAGSALTGRAVSLPGDAGRLAGGPRLDPHFQLELLGPAGDQRNVDLGPIPTAPPAHHGRGRGLPDRVHGRRADPSPPISASATAGASGSATSRCGAARTDLPGTAADWRPGVDRQNRVEAAAGGPGALSVRFDSDGRTTPVLTSRWFPERAPGARRRAGRHRHRGRRGRHRTQRREPIDLAGVGTLPRAPGLAGAAAIVDLDLLLHWGSRAGRTALIQVWFDTEDPAAVERVRAALQRDGIEISRVRRVSEVRATPTTRPYRPGACSWGSWPPSPGCCSPRSSWSCSSPAAWRRRSRDLACLGLSGVPRRGLGRVAVGEQLPTVLLAVLVGGGCGLLGAVFALPTVPLFAQPRPVSDLDLSAPLVARPRGAGGGAGRARARRLALRARRGGGRLAAVAGAGGAVTGLPVRTERLVHIYHTEGHDVAALLGRRPGRTRRRAGRAARAVRRGQVDPAEPARRDVPAQRGQDLPRRHRAVRACPSGSSTSCAPPESR